MADITAGTAAVQSIYTNEIATSFEFLKPEKWGSLMRSHGNQGADYFSTITALGFKVATKNETYSHFEDDWITETVAIADPVVYGVAGATATFTIGAASIPAAGAGDPYIRVKDTLITQAGNMVYVTDITGIVVTVAPSDTGVTLGATDFVAGDELFITSNANGEGTNQPDSRFSGTREYSNNTQIIKETMTATGTSMTDGMWFDKISYPGGSDGQNIEAYYIKGQEDAEFRMAIGMEGACLFGQKNNNATVMLDPETGKAVNSTEGTYSYIENQGNEVNYTPGSFTVSKFNEIGRIANKEYAPEHYCAFLGYDFNNELDDTFVDYNKDTDISFTKDVMGGKEIEIGFSVLKKGGRNYGFKKLQSFSNPKGAGAPGYDYSSQAMFIPLGMKKDLNPNGTAGKLPTVGIRYKELGGYNRFMEVWTVAGAGKGTLVTENDSRNLYLRSDIGAHHMVGNQMILLRP